MNTTTTLPTPTELADSIKAEVAKLIAAGKIPTTVASFADLHEYVDANCLGGTEALFEELVSESATDQEHQAKLDKLNAVMAPAHNMVDAWIKAGGHATASTSGR